MVNNDIMKKLRVALQLRDDDIIEILKLANFEILLQIYCGKIKIGRSNQN